MSEIQVIYTEAEVKKYRFVFGFPLRVSREEKGEYLSSLMRLLILIRIGLGHTIALLYQSYNEEGTKNML